MSDNKPTLGTVMPQIPLATTWKPGPANGYDPCGRDLVEVGDRFLVLVHCVDNRLTKKDYWDMHVIVATVDGWDDANGDSWGAWSWSDVSWYMELTKGNMPQLGDGVASLPIQKDRLPELLAAHRRFHDKAGCPGVPECYVCVSENELAG